MFSSFITRRISFSNGKGKRNRVTVLILNFTLFLKCVLSWFSYYYFCTMAARLQ